MNQFNHIVSAALMALLLFLSAPLSASHSQEFGATYANTIQGGHSGNWMVVGQPGQGYFIEVIDDNQSPTGKRVVLAWFTFVDGKQAWIIATGDVTREGNKEFANMKAWIYEGNDFPPFYDPARTTEKSWGDIDLLFIGCDHAELNSGSSYPGFHSGSGPLQLIRVTSIRGTSCDPDLGGDEPPDDHGDSLQTATWFATHLVYNDPIKGKLENRSDKDVFVFQLLDAQEIVIFTLGSTQTSGELYRVNGTRETLIAESVNGGHPANMLIEKVLSAGTYSIHLTGTGIISTGSYTLWLQTQTDG